MNEIVEQYKKECEVVSKGVSRFYQTSLIILVILFTLVSLILNNFWEILACIPFWLVVCRFMFIICSKIYDKQLKAKAMGISKLNEAAKITAYEKIIDEYQKRWISNYIRKNKLSKLSKLSIVINELQQEIDRKSTKKYIEILIIPAIFSLIVAITDSNSVNESAVLFIRYIFCVIETMCVVYFLNNSSEYNIFKRYTGLERLKELLIHAAIKHGRK